MKRLLLFTLILPKLVIASGASSLYARHINASYSLSSMFAQKSQENIREAEILIHNGKSYEEIFNFLAFQRSILEDQKREFGSHRKKCLLTQGNNYFIMRELVVGVLKRMFISNNFRSAQALCLTPEQKAGKTGYQFRLESPIEIVESHMNKSKNGIFTPCEEAMSRFLVDLGWLNKDEFQWGRIIDSRYEKVHEGIDYIKYLYFTIQRNRHNVVKARDEASLRYLLALDSIEKENPGQFIMLSRSFLRPNDAQEILVLKHPKALSWEECPFVLVHTDHKWIPYYHRLLNNIFEAIKMETDPVLLQTQFFIFEYTLSTQTPCFRGSAAIKEWFTESLYRYKGYQMPCRGYCETDQYAQILPFSDFLLFYLKKDGALKPIKK